MNHMHTFVAAAVIGEPTLGEPSDLCEYRRGPKANGAVARALVAYIAGNSADRADAFALIDLLHIRAESIGASLAQLGEPVTATALTGEPARPDDVGVDLHDAIDDVLEWWLCSELLGQGEPDSFT